MHLNCKFNSHTNCIIQLLEEHNVFVVSSKRSTLDKCSLPLGIRLFVSAGHSEYDLKKICDALKAVVPSALKNRSES